MDETWGSFLSVVAQFIQNGEPKNVQVKDGYCFVPPELGVGAFELCLRGDDGESVVASVNRLTFEVCEGFDPSGETPLPPSPDLYTQLIKEIDSGKKIAQSVRDDADSGKFNGGWYTPSVTQKDENTLRMVFTPSKDDMPDVEHTDITLPSGGGGTSDHSKLSNRDAADQHPISAITGLEKALEDKQPTGNYLTSEQDPTVPKWAKQPQKPAYTAQEVGALPDTIHIPSTADDVNAEPAGAVSQHNVSDAAHSDIRLLIQGLSERLSVVADSDDTTLDQLSEVVAYIKSNRSLIENITTSKVSVADIIDNLTTNAANKPLSAAQGVALKELIDAITIPTALPNPNALTFTGAVSGSYDGSAPLELEIPSGGGGLTVTNTAAVGQTVKITAVDETGQPTEWEAVDMASGGGAFVDIMNLVISEEVQYIFQNIDFDLYDVVTVRINQNENVNAYFGFTDSNDYFASGIRLYNAADLSVFVLDKTRAFVSYSTGYSVTTTSNINPDFHKAGMTTAKNRTGLKMYKSTMWKAGDEIKIWGRLKT